MRILVDASPVTKGGGGICTYFLGLLKGWSEAGFSDHLDIVGTDALPAEVDRILPGYASVHRRGSASTMPRVATQQLSVPLMARSMAPRPDILFATTPVIPLARPPVPIVVVVYDLRFRTCPEEFRPLQRAYRRVTYQHGLAKASAILAISRSTAEHVARAVPRAVTPTVVHLGSDHVDGWCVDGRPEAHGLAFAHWTNKRPDVAVKAWAILHTRHPTLQLPLHIAGATQSVGRELRGLAAAQGIDHLVHVHGFLNDAEYRSLFVSSSVLLMPSSLEGFGLPVIEALRLGIPVVAADDPAMREAGGSLPVYADSGSPDSFAKACETALFDASRRQLVTTHGRAHTDAFLWRRTAERTRAEMEAVLASGPRKPLRL